MKSQVGEHATSGVTESTMREVKRQPRTLKLALGAHVVEDRRATFHPWWIPTMVSDAISFFRISRDGSTAAMRR